MTIRLKRIYEDPAPSDGVRILIDGLWPRGVSRERAAIARWMKELAPSAELRRWFDHVPARWEEFQARYAQELRDRPGPVAELRELAAQGPVTLVYAAKDEEHNNAVALRGFLEGR